jgi:ABC-type bacteriocin/lantibiotic exporter with double-glycine peptidase domain
MKMIAAAVPLLLATALQVPYVHQQKDTCGAAALAMVLQYWGARVAHDEVKGELLQPELHGIAGSRLAAFAAGKGMTAVAHAGDLDHLRHHVGAGRPMIVSWAMGGGRYHDVVVVGFDEAGRRVIVHDPARGADRRIAMDAFEKKWAAAGHWTLLVAPAPK